MQIFEIVGEVVLEKVVEYFTFFEAKVLSRE